MANKKSSQDVLMKQELIDEIYQLMGQLSTDTLKNKGVKLLNNNIEKVVSSNNKNSDLLDLQILANELRGFVKNTAEIEKTTKQTDLGDYSDYFQDMGLLHSRLQGYRREVSDFLVNYKVTDSQKNDIFRSDLKDLEEAILNQSNFYDYDGILNEIQNINNDIDTIKSKSDAKTLENDRDAKKIFSSFSHFNAKQSVGNNVSKVNSVINKLITSGTKERQEILKQQNEDSKYWEKYTAGFKDAENQIELDTKKIADVSRVIGKNKIGSVSGNSNILNASERIAAISQLAKNLNEQSFEFINNLNSIRNTPIDSTSTQAALKAFSNAGYVALDFETTYKSKKYDPVNYAPVTFGISDGTKEGTDYGIIAGDIHALDRMITFLTDERRHESQKILAEQLGLGERDDAGFYHKKDANGLDNGIITESELRNYIANEYLNKLKSGESSTMLNFDGNERINKFGHQREDMKLATMDYVYDVIKDKRVVAAADKFDINQANSMLSKSKQINPDNGIDILEKIVGKYRYNKGWTVENLAKLFLPKEYVENFGAHGAADDAMTEALLASEFYANPSKFNSVIEGYEAEIEKAYEQYTGKKAYETRLNKDNKLEKFATSDFKNFHDPFITSIANNDYSNASENALNKMMSMRNFNAEFMNKLSGEVARLDNNNLSGHLDYFKGKTTSERIANATGRNVSSINTESIFDMISDFQSEMASENMYVQADVFDDHGVGKVRLSLMNADDYRLNNELINDENFATMIDFEIAGENSVLNSNNRGSVVGLNVDRYSMDLKDSLQTKTAAMIHKAREIIKNNYNVDGKTVNAKEASNMISRYGKLVSQDGTYKHTGEFNAGDTGSQNPNSFEMDRLQNTAGWSGFIGNLLRGDRGLLETVLSTKSFKRNGEDFVDINAIDTYNLDESIMADFFGAMSFLQPDVDEKQLKQYLSSLEMTAKTTGKDLSKDLQYQLLKNPKAARSMGLISELINKGITANWVGLSQNNYKAGKAGLKKFRSNAFHGILGQEYAEGWVKTQTTGTHTKKLGVEDLKAAGWKEDVFREITNPDDMLISVGNLPAEIMNGILGLTGRSSSDDQLLMPMDVARSMEGVGAEKWSDGYIEDSATLEYIANLIGKTGKDLKEMQENDVWELGNTSALTNELRIDKNFRVPIDSTLTAIRKKNDKFQIQYRQSGEVSNSSKLVGDLARMQAAIAMTGSGETMDRNKLKKTLNDRIDEVSNLYQNIINRDDIVSASDNDILGMSQEYGLSNFIATERSNILKQYPDVSAENLRRELSARLATRSDALKKIVKGYDAYREAPDEKRLADMRVNPQYIMSAYRNVFSSVDKFKSISENMPILNELFTVKKGENGKEFIDQKEGFSWDNIDYKNYFQKNGEGFRSINDLIAYVHSINDEFGLLADALTESGVTERSNRQAMLNSGYIAMNRSGYTNFMSSVGSGGAFESATDVNEVANVRGTMALLKTTKKDLDNARTTLMKDYTGDAAEYDSFENWILESMIQRNESALNKANLVMDAADANKYGQFDSIMRSKGPDSKKYTIGTGNKQTDLSSGFLNLNDIDLKSEHENWGYFTEEEWKNSGLSKIYESFGEYDRLNHKATRESTISNANNALALNLSGIDKEYLKSHGIKDNELMLALGALKFDENNNVLIGEEMEATLSLLRKIQNLFNGEEVSDKHIQTNYQNKLQSTVKELKKNSFDKASNSMYMRTQKASDNWAGNKEISQKYNWINERTARNLLSIDREASISSINRYLSEEEGLGTYLSDDDKGLLKNKKLSKEKKLELADKARDAYLDSLMNMTYDEQAQNFQMLMARSPYLTAYSSSLGNTVINKSKYANNRQFDNQIALTGSTSSAFNADWDGDIIAARTMLMRTENEQHQKWLTEFIDRRQRILKAAYEMTEGSLDLGYSKEDYQSMLNKNASTVLKGNISKAIEGIVLSGNMDVGLANFDESQMQDAFNWYKHTRKANDQYDEWDLSSGIYQNMMTQLGEQVGISSKMMGNLLIDSKGNLGFNSHTARSIFDQMSPDKRAWMGWENENDVENSFGKMIESSVKTFFTATTLQEAYDAAISQGIKDDGFIEGSKIHKLAEGTPLADQYNKMATLLYANKGKDFTLEKFFSLLNNDAFTKSIREIGDNEKEISEYSNKYLTDVTGFKRNNTYKQHDYDTIKNVEDLILSTFAKSFMSPQINAEQSYIQAENLGELSQQLQEIISLIRNIGQNLGNNNNNNNNRNKNLRYEELKEEWRDADKIETKPLSVKLNEKYHQYSAIAGIPLSDENGNILDIMSASRIGSWATTNEDVAMNAQMKYYNDILNSEDDTGIVNNENSKIDISKWADSGFKNTQGDNAYTLLASSLTGTLFHRVQQIAIQKAKNGEMNLDESALDPSKLGYEEDKIYMALLDRLKRLFGGSDEILSKYFESKGGINANITEGLNRLISNGAELDASNLINPETPLGFTIQAYKNGKPVEGKSYNGSATLDTAKFDFNKMRFNSQDWKNKNPSNGKMWTGDIIEGIIQQYALSANAEELLTSLGLTYNDDQIAQIKQNTKNAAAEFIKVNGGKSALIGAGIIGKDVDDIDAIVGSIMSFAEEARKNPNMPRLTQEQMDIASYIKGELPVFEKNEIEDMDSSKLTSMYLKSLEVEKQLRENLKKVYDDPEREEELNNLISERERVNSDMEKAISERTDMSEFDRLRIAEKRMELNFNKEGVGEERFLEEQDPYSSLDSNELVNLYLQSLKSEKQLRENLNKINNDPELSARLREAISKRQMINTEIEKILYDRTTNGDLSKLEYSKMVEGMIGVGYKGWDFNNPPNEPNESNEGNGGSGDNGDNGDNRFYMSPKQQPPNQPQQDQTLMGSIIKNTKYRLSYFFDYQLIYTVFNKLRQTFQKLVSTTQQLDVAMTNIQIATGYNINQTKELMLQYTALASEIGRTAQEVATAANDWLRAGYEGEEANELVRSSMYLSTLGMMDSAKATEALISILKGWKLQTDEVIGVVDKLVTGIKNSVYSVMSTGHKFNCG